MQIVEDDILDYLSNEYGKLDFIYIMMRLFFIYRPEPVAHSTSSAGGFWLTEKVCTVESAMPVILFADEIDTIL